VRLWLAIAVLIGFGCGGRPKPKPARPATVGVGQCADPSRDGVLSDKPSLDRADRDLDGDGRLEAIVADTTMCSGAGNCRWNIFAKEQGCWRYLGTVAASGLELLSDAGEGGYRPVVGWWRFSGRRSLRQEYRYRHGGYRLVDTLICREQDDDRLLCASESGSEGE
jgi:hypothetical protein